jgi:hypothetical protein
VRRDGGLADALAGPDDRQRRQVERLQPWRLEAEVGADVRQSEHERARREPEALRRRQHRLIGEVNHDVSFDSVEPVDERDAVVLSSAQLLGAADEQCADELVLQCCERVAHHGRVVLPVDDRNRPHGARTSSSMRSVYFSYSRVRVENWMIFSCPWYG